MAKGSKKHILQLIDNNCIGNINELLNNTNAVFEDQDSIIPVSSINPKEVTLSTYLTKEWGDASLGTSFRKWWIKYGNRTPQWDLIAKCKIDGVDGILLVEAKAHKSEIKGDKGKKQAVKEESIQNHKQIRRSIEEARDSINKFNREAEIDISIDTCYQLSNRVACAWWLASHKIPVVLLYLGFLNDHYFKDKFESDRDWQKCFEKHAGIVGVQTILNHPIKTENAEFVINSKGFDLNRFVVK